MKRFACLYSILRRFDRDVADESGTWTIDAISKEEAVYRAYGSIKTFFEGKGYRFVDEQADHMTTYLQGNHLLRIDVEEVIGELQRSTVENLLAGLDQDYYNEVLTSIESKRVQIAITQQRLDSQIQKAMRGEQ